jgi:two-component system, NtrC family, sensor kinase
MKILLIDDEPDIVRVLSRSLKADGYEVSSAASGAEGLAEFDRVRPEIVITDIKMPGMDGIEVLKQVKQREPDAEVIIITGHGDIHNAVESLHFGASDFINKPVRDEALSIALKRAEEKIEIRRRLKEYTHDLEAKIEVATRELRRRSNFLFKLIRSSYEGIVATDENFRIVIFNPGAERIFGYFQDEVVNRRHLPELLSEELAGTVQRAMTAQRSFRELPWREASITSKSGEPIPVMFSGSILYERDQKLGAVVFFQDLREIKHLQRELVSSERLAAVGQTVAGLAHGIKNILHGLKGGRYLVDVGISRKDDLKLRKGWEMIKRAIDRTSNLVMDMLSYSKEREPQFEKCLPNAIAAEVCDLVRERAEQERIKLVMDFDPAIGAVRMDPHTLHTVLLNLVSNAVDACLFDENTSKKWRVAVRTAAEPRNLIRFEVSDNGTGMNDEVKEKMFTSFYSTKGHRGTGLGLLVTHKLVEEHGGRIEVETQLGQGTTARVWLPYREELSGA